MSLLELIEALDQRYGNPHVKGNDLILQAIEELRKFAELQQGK